MEFLIALLAGWLVYELAIWLPKVCDWLTLTASRRLPPEFQDRYYEEWLSFQREMPFSLVKLSQAVGFHVAATTITFEAGGYLVKPWHRLLLRLLPSLLYEMFKYFSSHPSLALRWWELTNAIVIRAIWKSVESRSLRRLPRTLRAGHRLLDIRFPELKRHLYSYMDSSPAFLAAKKEFRDKLGSGRP